jgi:antitoxin ParD1/3/4
MSSSVHQKISVSLPPELVRYADEYEKSHGLKSRSDVLAQALLMLRQRELEESYRQMREDYQLRREDMFDANSGEGLEPSDGREWL